MSDHPTVGRLATADAVRTYQRDWLADARTRAENGDPFVICNSDEFEEILSLFSVPVLVINYWNNIVLREKKREHFEQVLRDRGFTDTSMFALGLATAIDPANAPWGGLPKPAMILASTRSEVDLRVCELWAREFGCESYPLDFGFTSPFKQIPPGNWFELIRDDWPQLIDSDRLELRIDENKALIAHLEQLLGESFSFRRLSESMDLVNEQMDFYWAARDLMARAERTPVTLRDQLAMYQMIWHRGTKTAVEFARRYYEEVAERVDGSLAAYENESIRLLYWDTAAEPAFHPFLQETYGAVFVACPFTVSAACYARTVYDDDPLRAMSARHLFLLERTPEWGVREAIDQHCDAVIGIESPNDHPSALAKAIEDHNIPYLGVPDIRDSPERREMVVRFLEDRLGAKRR
jgi:hypothetical protein